MNKIVSFCLIIVTSILIFSSCNGGEEGVNEVNITLKELIDVGYSVQELSLRTEYTEDELIDAYLYDDNTLSDSSKNAKILMIKDLNQEKKIIPINKLNISAYDGLWQVYTKAQNLPRVSLYTGIGVSKVACALMKRKPLVGHDSIRAMVGYVNMMYDLADMPPSIDQYYEKTTAIKDLTVPATFRSNFSNFSNKTKLKIDYYIYQNEQLELRANDNLKKSIDGKVNCHVRSALEKFISDDVSSLINTTKNLFKDSLEQAQFYKDKLSERLALDGLNEEIRNEIITYCVSVNCSRAILINEVLNYKEFSPYIGISKRVVMENYMAQMEEITALMEKKRDNLGIDAGIMAIGIPLGIATAGVMNPATSMLSVQAAKIFIFETLEYAGLDGIVKDLLGYRDNELVVESLTAEMQENIETDINTHMLEYLDGKGNYYEKLNENTSEYYNQVRNFFGIK